jgi:hypothetical protein
VILRLIAGHLERMGTSRHAHDVVGAAIHFDGVSC